MKRFGVIIAVLLCLPLLACSPVVSSPLPMPEPPTPAPLGVPISVNNDGIKVPGCPAYMEFFGVRDGTVLDTWTNDGYVNIGQARVDYKKGDNLCIFAYNGYSEPVKFNIYYEDIKGETAYCQATNQTYSKAPPAAWMWFKISKPQPEIAAKSVVPIPFSLSIPKDVELPEQWEFRIHIQPVNVGTMVGDASIRILVSK